MNIIDKYSSIMADIPLRSRLIRLLIRCKLFDIIDFGILWRTITFDRMAAQIRSERVNTTYRELVNIRRMLSSTNILDGDIAELGVYQGGTARLMALTSPNKTVHLFDTFTGLPCKNKEHDRMSTGELEVDITKVKKYLKDCSNVVFHAGLFPDTTKGLDCKFSFVNLDADQYQSTLDGLKYFYPRLVKHGVIILHDYFIKQTPGIKKAIEDYRNDLVCIPIWDTQMIIIKL